MNRRTLLKAGLGAALAGVSARPAAPGVAVKAAGERLIPIEGGKYKVWTQQVGNSPIKVLTLHGGPGFSHLYEAYVAKFKNELTPDERKTLEKYEAAKNYDAPEYQKIVLDRIFSKHICRVQRWPAPVELAFRFANQKIYNYMQGPNEFVITGTFKHWDRMADVKNIKTKALLMGARYDEMDPDEMRRIASMMPNARAVISERGSHLCMYDDQDWYFCELISFLKEA